MGKLLPQPLAAAVSYPAAQSDACSCSSYLLSDTTAASCCVLLSLQLIVATGKARGPWVGEVVPRLGPPMPGVFIQGLLVCDAQVSGWLQGCLCICRRQGGVVGRSGLGERGGGGGTGPRR
jgi:hypothetical protein